LKNDFQTNPLHIYFSHHKRWSDYEQQHRGDKLSVNIGYMLLAYHWRQNLTPKIKNSMHKKAAKNTISITRTPRQWKNVQKDIYRAHINQLKAFRTKIEPTCMQYIHSYIILCFSFERYNCIIFHMPLTKSSFILPSLVFGSAKIKIQLLTINFQNLQIHTNLQIYYMLEFQITITNSTR
jgi:hypothetical protein